MNISEAIKNRRSIRNYKDSKIERKVLEDILYYGTLAPSGHNRQPWHFIVIEDQSIKESIADFILKNHPVVGQRTANVIRQVPALIVVYDRLEYDNTFNTLFDIQSIGASIQNICLKAQDYDLGTLWIGFICSAEESVNKLLNINNKLIGAIAIGYPNEFPDARPRLDLSELIEWR